MIRSAKTPKIQALILSQFHKNKGFILVHVIQKQNHLTQTQFLIYSELILYQDELCDRLLVSQFMDEYYIIGIPLLSINEEKYKRVKYLYAVSILVYREYYWDQNLHGVYKEIVGKLAQFFKFVEQSSNIIYQNHKPQNNQYLYNVLQQAFTKINNNQQCVLSHFSNCFTIINLNRCPFERDSTKIKKSHVPITYLLQQEIQDIQSQFGKKLLQYAKIGDFNIRKICELMEDEEGVYKYYEKCMEMRIVFMGDMFSLENRYCLTSKIHRFVGERSGKDEEELASICQEVTLKKSNNENHKVTPNLLLFLYFQISRKTTLKKLIDSNLLLFQNINILKWIRISQIYGLIKRIHQKFGIEYYNINQNMNQLEFITEQKVRQHVQIKSMRNSMSSGLSGTNIKQEWERMNSMFNAHLKNMDTIDEICVSFRVSKNVLLGLINFWGQKNLKIYYVSQ